jgi:hypothetical protein
MGGSGFYSRHAAQHEEAASAAITMLERAAATAAIDRPGPLVIADFGSLQGRASLHPLTVAIDALGRRTSAATPVVVVHTDLPDRDFSSLFATVASDPDSYQRPGVFTYAAGRSFYERLFPDATLTIGWTATAAVWLRAVPCELPDHIFSYAESGVRRAQWKDAAAHDWHTFLAHRAEELHPGGQLVVSLPVAGPGYLDWMRVVEDGVRAALAGGAITAAEYGAMVLPTYLSEPADLRTGVAEFGGLVLHECEVATASDPAYTAFRVHGDPGRYADDAVAQFRTWSEATLRSRLGAARDASARDAATDALFARVRDALAATPTECAWSIGLLRIGRDGDVRAPTAGDGVSTP